ncbi:MAG: DUF4199 domain-containing protein [Bacteroidia bacterium]|nr:DUF4199 domain-containing protein [Bacteroidia bacterium]
MEETNPTTEEAAKQPTVMATGLRYGIISALVGIAWSLVRMVMGINMFDRDWSSWMGIIILIVMVVLAHKYFKDNGDGFMSYGQGLGISMVTITVSILISAVFTYIYMAVIDPGVFETFLDQTREQMESQGQSDDAINTAIEWTKKLFWVFFIIGSLFWGLIIGLIVSIFTQKKNPEPAF